MFILYYYARLWSSHPSSMSNRKNTSRCLASAGAAPMPLPVASRTRGAGDGRATTNPDPREEADAAAATNPPEAGDASTGVDPSQTEVRHTDSESESLYSVSDELCDEFVDAAAVDAAASLARNRHAASSSSFTWSTASKSWRSTEYL